MHPLAEKVLAGIAVVVAIVFFVSGRTRRHLPR